VSRSNTQSKTFMSFSRAYSLWPAICRSWRLPIASAQPSGTFPVSQWRQGHDFISYHCDSLLTGVADCLIHRLQSLQNAAARLATGAPRREHITPILRQLHYFIGYQYVSVFDASWQPWHSDHYQARCRRILPTIASSLLNSDGEHSDQRNDPSASYNAATTPSATDHSQQPVRVRGTTFLLPFATPS